MTKPCHAHPFFFRFPLITRSFRGNPWVYPVMPLALQVSNGSARFSNLRWGEGGGGGGGGGGG